MDAKADSKQTRKLVKGMTIPSRPTVMLEAIKAQNAFAPDLWQVARIISRDMVLSSLILEEANSRLPGLERQVASIDQAVMLLGLARVRTVITSGFLSAALVSREDRIQALRRASQRTAALAAWMARELPKNCPPCASGYLPAIDPDEAYVAGLFHDCGLAVLMQKFADYTEFYQHHSSLGGWEMVQSENDRYRTNHCLVGAMLCAQWQFPEHICAVVHDHHVPGDFNRPGKQIKDRRAVVLRAVLILAEQAAGELPPHEWPGLRDGMAHLFDLPPTALTELCARGAIQVPPPDADEGEG